MDEEYTIMSVEHPEETAWGFIGNNLDDYNRQNAGELNFQRLCYALYSPDMQIAGGVLGEIYWDWLHLDLLWIKEELRGHGYGHRLLLAIEEEAKRRGVKSIFLDTFSFQAPHFYEQHGYRLFGDLPDFPAGHHRYFFTKSL